MKEYEYIVLGIEEVLIDELVGVICMENYAKRTYEHGFRKIFDSYREMQSDYQSNKQDFENVEKEEQLRTAFVEKCEQQRKQMLDKFIVDVKENASGLNVRELVDDYMCQYNAEDVKTTGKRVCIYPYIISQLRKYEEGKKNGC